MRGPERARSIKGLHLLIAAVAGCGGSLTTAAGGGGSAGTDASTTVDGAAGHAAADAGAACDAAYATSEGGLEPACLRCGNACVDALSDNDNCGSCGNACGPGLVCVDGACRIGNDCSTNSDCASQSCVVYSCAPQCKTDADCPSAPGWSCTQGVCSCVPDKNSSETCDGYDNDCSGIADDPAMFLGETSASDSDCAKTDGPGFRCQDGSCVCPPENLCGGVCVDTQTDQQNCGSCGHACAGTCVAGRCEVALATGQHPVALTVHAGNVYWLDYFTTNGSVMKVSVDGGAPTTLAAIDSLPGDVVADDGGVYWTQAGAGGSDGVVKMVLTAGAAQTLAANQPHPTGIAVDSSRVYWGNSGDGTIKAVARGGGTPVTLASGQGDVLRLDTDGTTLYWVSQGKVTALPLGGEAPTIVSSGYAAADVALTPTGMVLAADCVPFLPASSCTTMCLHVPLGSTYAIAADATTAYGLFETMVSDVVFAVPLAGGPLVVLDGSGYGDLVDIAADDSAVYWADSGHREIVKLTSK